MPSEKLLNGVAHNIMHHAVSGLSFIHPHLSKSCRSANILLVSLNLMKESPLPLDFPIDTPLDKSSQALHKKFIEILSKEGFTLSDLSSMTLSFHFSPNRSSDYSGFLCKADLISKKGKSFKHEMYA